ncbi:MAG: hypothetical protein JXA89_12705 [Anaerolineae bacterium]|nr:hypothetical protein [Anaerolineae bacterium]
MHRYWIAVKEYVSRWKKMWFWGAVVCVLILVGLTSSDLLPEDYFKRRLSEQVGGRAFDLITWELEALLNKLGNEFIAPQDTLSEAQRHALVVAYFDAIERARTLRREIDNIYSQLSGQDSAGQDEAGQAAAQAASQEQELAKLRVWIDARQNLVEGILEEQVSAELENEGFGRYGYVWPPVKIRFTDLPLLLVVSSRAAITREADVNLRAGLPLSEQIALEDNVDLRFEEMRSLVTRIGGLSAYPAMILETDSLVWLADTFAHEWAHHYLIVFPLGYNYTQSGEMTSLNETTASIVGREVGRRVILHYYPELEKSLPALPVVPDCPPMSAGELIWPDEPPSDVFDYNREMRNTRLRVDELLAQGQIEEAEQYMEARRQLFVEQGHSIRKLNQAYFAFHGSYATSPSTGNPIGGQLEWLRGQHPTLRAFVRDIRSVSRYQDLTAALQVSAQICQN